MTLNLVTHVCTVYSVHDDITMTGETCFVMVSRANRASNEDRPATAMQKSFVQHLPLQPRVGSAGCTCCARNGYKLC